jgi:DNA-binding Lrp family transcriptional regulator
MRVRAYILIKCAVGTARRVHKGLERLAVADATVLSAETVVGPFDVIALLESEDLDRLGRAVTEGVHRLHGIERTATCLIIDLG